MARDGDLAAGIAAGRDMILDHGFEARDQVGPQAGFGDRGGGEGETVHRLILGGKSEAITAPRGGQRPRGAGVVGLLAPAESFRQVARALAGETMSLRAWALAAGLTTGALLATSPDAPAQDAQPQGRPVQLKLSHWLPPAHPLQAAMQDWADDIKKQSGGTITSVIFPAEQLGKAFDHYDMARDGIADFAYVNPGYQPGRFPIVAAGELPFLFGDAKTGTGAFDAWYRPHAAREMKDVHYCFGFINDLSTIHSRKPITLPADVRGLKLRPADATMGAFTTLLGGSNVQASAPGSRDLLERGVADGIYFPWGSTVLFGIDKVVKYHLEAPLYVTTFVWAMNQAKYDALSAGQKKVIDDHCTTEWAIRFASPWVDFEHAGIEKIRAEPGHVLTKLTAEQLNLWREAALPLQQSWAAGARKAGADPEALTKDLHAKLDQYKAGY